MIISDQWVPPTGPDWAAFSIRVPENDVASIPPRLEEREHDAERMGAIAREQWEQWFSEEVCFHRIVSWCNDIKASRRLPIGVLRWMPYAQLLRPVHLRRWAGPRARRLFPRKNKSERLN